MKKILLSLTLAILLLPSFVLAANSQADCAANETFYPDIAGSGGVCQRNQATNPNTTNPNPNSICNGKTCTYTPLEPIPGLPQSGNDFAGFLNGMFKLLFTIGGMIAVASLVYGGITYMVSEIVGKIEWAKRQMRAALWGLALLVAAWLILYTINPDLITFKLNVQSITTNTPTPATNTSGTGGVQQNLGDPSKFSNGNPFGFSSLSVTQGYAVSQALGCSSYNIACLGAQQYITYDPSQVNTPAVQQAITNYNSNCSGMSNLWIGNVRTIDGSIVGTPGQTALVCAGPLQ